MLRLIYYRLSGQSLEIAKKKFLLHRTDFGSLYLAIYKELGDDQNMNVVSRCLVFIKLNHLTFGVLYKKLWLLNYMLSEKSLGRVNRICSSRSQDNGRDRIE